MPPTLTIASTPSPRLSIGLDISADGADIAGDLAKAMRKIKIEGLTGELTWNDEGQVEKPATAYVIQDGKYIAS